MDEEQQVRVAVLPEQQFVFALRSAAEHYFVHMEPLVPPQVVVSHRKTWRS